MKKDIYKEAKEKLIDFIKHLRYLNVDLREEKNDDANTPSFEKLYEMSQHTKLTGWTLMPTWANLFHDNQSSMPEIKFNHLDGREYIYTTDDPFSGIYRVDHKGSYNYFPPVVDKRLGVSTRGIVYIYNVVGHFLFDMLPQIIPYVNGRG